MYFNLYPLCAAITANLTAQIVKPLFYYRIHKKWNLDLIFDSGGFPSSHTSMVTALTIAVGVAEGVDSTLFAVTLIFSLIVCYDAANVRYYAGQNIQITQQLIKDIQDLTQTKLDDPIYMTKVKNILGHKWIEIFGGLIWGAMIAGIWFIVLG